ncbi:MAG: polysaccharide deacetylase family protein [Nitrospirae bacterium]|nr:polysaccharide deacetylase family protein [Nitrospirota bacterium]
MIRGHLIVHPVLRQRLPEWVPAEMPLVVPSTLQPPAAGASPALTFRPLGASDPWTLVTETPHGPFEARADLGALMDFVRYERYRPPYRPLYTRIPLPIHRIPRRLRATAYRWLSSRSKRHPRASGFTFPAWPKDVTVDTLSLLGSMLNVDKLTGPDKSIFKIDPVWPEGKSYAVVLTHDVDSGWAFEHTENVAPLLKIESSAGVRSAWYFVVKTIPRREILTRGLERDGHEIGFHCYNHDHRFPFLSEAAMRARLDRCRPFLDRFGVKGMRSANYLKSSRFLSIMGERFEYDLSFRDSYHGAGGAHGCSTVHPFRIGGGSLLEIPTTMPDDYDLFSRGLSPEEALKMQIESMENIKIRGGVVNLVTHTEPHLSVNKKGLCLYQEIVRYVSSDPAAWITLPRDLAAWRKRASLLAPRETLPT